MTNLKLKFFASLLFFLVVVLRIAYGGVPAQVESERPTVSVTETVIPTSTPTKTSTALPTTTPTITPTITNTPLPTRPVPYTDWARDRLDLAWEVDCYDELWYNGFQMADWAGNFCVPGVIYKHASFYDSPTDYYGLMSSYAEWVMEAQFNYRGVDRSDYLDGVATMSCADIGKVLWLRLPGISDGWEGPFLSVDCSQRTHLYYHLVGMGIAVEVGYRTAQRWGGPVAQHIEVHMGDAPPESDTWEGVYLPDWWIENIVEFNPLEIVYD